MSSFHPDPDLGQEDEKIVEFAVRRRRIVVRETSVLLPLVLAGHGRPTSAYRGHTSDTVY